MRVVSAHRLSVAFTRRKLVLIAVAAVPAVVGSRAHAEPVIWSPATTISADTDVVSQGVLQYGYALSNVATTVNGVSFTASNSQTTLGTNVTLSNFTAGGGINNTAFGSGAGAPYSGLTTAYQNLIKGASYNANGGAISASLQNLTAGQTYAVQYWVHDSRAGATATRTGSLTSAGGNTIATDYNSTNAAGGVGTTAVGIFTAGAATQVFNFSGNQSSQLNAIQVREVTNIGRWTGLNGGTWDSSSTPNFASNFRTDALVQATSDDARAGIKSVTFADTYFDAGVAVPVSQAAIAIDAAGVSTNTRFENSTVNYVVSGGAITGTGVVVSKEGSGTVTLSSANSYTGGTYINGGTLSVGSAGGLGTGPVLNNATLNLTFANTGTTTYTGLSTSLSGTGTVNISGLGTGTNSTLISGNLSGFTGTINIGVGTVAGGGKVAFSGGAAGIGNAIVNVLTNATLYANSAVTHTAAIVLNGGNTGESLGQLRLEGATWSGSVTLAGTYDAADGAVGNNSGTGTISGVISESGGSRPLRKMGNGTLALLGNNTYTGGTSIASGTLLVNTPATGTNSGTGIGPVTANANTTLGGNGQIRPTGANAVTIAGNATLAPGNAGIGSLTFDAGGTSAQLLNLATGSVLAMQFNANGTSDRVVLTNAVTGDVRFAGTTTINFSETGTPGSVPAGTVFTLFSADAPNAYSGLTLSGDQIVGGLVVGSGLAAYPGSTLSISGNNIVLTVVPEPGTTAALLTLGSGLLLRRRRQR